MAGSVMVVGIDAEVEVSAEEALVGTSVVAVVLEAKRDDCWECGLLIWWGNGRGGRIVGLGALL